MKKIYRLFLGLALLCPIFNASAQNERVMNVPQYENHLQAADYAFGNLNKSFVTTGILYDKVFKNAHLETFLPSEPSNSGHWLNAYYELHQAYSKATPDYKSGRASDGHITLYIYTLKTIYSIDIHKDNSQYLVTEQVKILS
jgi:hypothetical protein